MSVSGVVPHLWQWILLSISVAAAAGILVAMIGGRLTSRWHRRHPHRPAAMPSDRTQEEVRLFEGIASHSHRML